MTGYDFYSRGSPVISVTTSEGKGGQQDAFIHLKGVDSHEHLWIPYPAGIGAAGHRLKDRGIHVSSAASVDLGVPFARAKIDWDKAANTPRVALAAVNHSSAATAVTDGPHSSTGKRSAVHIGEDARPSVLVEFALIPRSAASNSAYQCLEWSSSVDWMLAWRIA